MSCYQQIRSKISGFDDDQERRRRIQPGMFWCRYCNMWSRRQSQDSLSLTFTLQVLTRQSGLHISQPAKHFWKRRQCGEKIGETRHPRISEICIICWPGPVEFRDDGLGARWDDLDSLFSSSTESTHEQSALVTITIKAILHLIPTG